MTHHCINKGQNRSRLFVRERVELLIELSGRWLRTNIGYLIWLQTVTVEFWPHHISYYRSVAQILLCSDNNCLRSYEPTAITYVRLPREYVATAIGVDCWQWSIMWVCSLLHTHMHTLTHTHTHTPTHTYTHTHTCRHLEWHNLEATVNENNTIDVRDVTNNAREHLGEY